MTTAASRVCISSVVFLVLGAHLAVASGPDASSARVTGGAAARPPLPLSVRTLLGFEPEREVSLGLGLAWSKPLTECARSSPLVAEASRLAPVEQSPPAGPGE